MEKDISLIPEIMIYGYPLHKFASMFKKLSERPNGFSIDSFEGHVEQTIGAKDHDYEDVLKIVEEFRNKGLVSEFNEEGVEGEDFTDGSQRLFLTEVGKKVQFTTTIGRNPSIEFDLPFKIVRSVLRLFFGFNVEEGSLGNFIYKNSCLSLRESKKLGQDLLENKIVQLENGHYDLTLKGRALQKKRMVKKLNRKKAQDILDGLILRAKEVNTNSIYLYKVSKLYVFGSYLRKETDIGDIDIIYELKRKYEGNVYREKERELLKSYYAEKKGSRLSHFEELAYPIKMVEKYLKNRSPYIDLQSINSDILSIAGEVHKIIDDN